MPTRKPTASSDSARYAPWDVIIVPFPYADKLAEKRRPALVISKPALEKDHGLVWLAMITSAENRGWASDVEISDLTRAGLPAPSLVRTAKIATVESARILKRVGMLALAARRGVVAAMSRYTVTE
jgi:mRNA interferase MazF